jgi:leucyl aminopeptidase
MKNNLRLVEPTDADVPVWLVTMDALDGWLDAQPSIVGDWVRRHRYQAKPGSHLMVPGFEGSIAGVILGVTEPIGMWDTSGLPNALGAGTYGLNIIPEAATKAALGWALGCYEFGRYKSSSGDAHKAALAWPNGADRAYVARAATATGLVRDLVNTTAADLGPEELAQAALDVAKQFGATASVTVGDDLLAANFPMIHAVGRAATGAPRLIDLQWGDADHPAITLVGKGVCFDSGGLDLKSAEGMILMKKDMGGAATALGLAQMIMDAELSVRLRVLIPAVENAVSASAYHPGDILDSRKGLTVEVGNTDAEGRLVLADALAEADTSTPEMLIDFATLTGAARVALGVDLPALYAREAQDESALMEAALAEEDPLWPMPLWVGYEKMIESKIADLHSTGTGRLAGSISAALFLGRFVTETTRWMHIDLYAWNQVSRPGRPEGGEAQTMRALYRLIEQQHPAG